MEKWEFEKDDLWSAHSDFELSRPYRLWFEYLLFSPTMALADKMLTSKKGLTNQEKENLPDDFDDVIRVYKELDVKSILRYGVTFISWWQSNARKLGVRLTPPDVHTIAEIPPDVPFNVGLYGQQFSSFLDGTVKNYHDNGYGHLILSVPMTGNKSDLIKQFTAILENNQYTIPKPEKCSAYALRGQRLHLEPLKDGLRMLWIKAEEPELKKWQLGSKANISDEYAFLDADMKKAPDESYRKAKRCAGSNAHRAYSKALRIMENAARGRFPCQDEIEIPYMNWSEINKRLKGIKRKQKSRYRLELRLWREHLHWMKNP